MARKKHLINVHTSTGTTAPTSASLYLGEIAVQHTPNDPALWIKVGTSQSSTEYEKFIGETEITNLFQASTILGSGYTYSGLSYVNSATTIADAYSALTKELIDDELVIATALNNLNNRVDTLSGATGDNTEILEYIQENEEVVAGALNNLDKRLGTVETHMTGDYIPITGYMIASGSSEEELTLNDGDTVNEALGKLQKQMLDNEEAIAAGLNDLNTRLKNVDDVIAHNTGITQLSGAVQSLSSNIQSLSSATQSLSSATQSLSSDIQSITSATRTLSSATQSLSSATQTYAKATLTVNLNGVEQGKYTPQSGNTVIDLTAVTNGSDVLLTGYKLATGTTEEELAILATDTVNEAFGKIQKQNYDNEAVIAGALNNLDERITLVKSYSAAPADQFVELSGATTGINATLTAHINNGDIHVTAANKTTWDGKQDAIADLDTIRSNAEAGAAKVSNVQADWNTTATTDESYIKNKPTIPTVPTSNTAFTNDAGYITGYTETDPTVPAWAKAENKPTYTASEVGALPTGTTLDNVADGTTRKLSDYATTGTVNTLNNTVTAHTADTTIHVTNAEKSTWNGKQDIINDLETIRSNAEAGAAKVSNVQSDWNATTGLAVILNKPTIPSAPGTLTTTATTAQSTAANEALTGNISLHKVSKTGSYNDLTDKPTIPTVPAWATASTKPTYTANEVGALPTGTTLDDIADGTTRKLSDYATTTDLNNLSGGTTAHTSNSAIHIPTGGTEGQVLMIQNGVPTWVTPSTITYSSSAPTGGNDGDIWIQTS